MSTNSKKGLNGSSIIMVMKSFRSDCREAFVISGSYRVGDPLAPLRRSGEQWRGEASPAHRAGLHPSVTA
jgi:hypothetical protein